MKYQELMKEVEGVGKLKLSEQEMVLCQEKGLIK
jgi:hypothetical protein